MEAIKSIKDYMSTKRVILKIARENNVTSAQLELLLKMHGTGDFTPLVNHPMDYPIVEFEKRSMEAVLKLDDRKLSSVSADLLALSRPDKAYVVKGINPYEQRSRFVCVTPKGASLCQVVSEYLV